MAEPDGFARLIAVIAVILSVSHILCDIILHLRAERAASERVANNVSVEIGGDTCTISNHSSSAIHKVSVVVRTGVHLVEEFSLGAIERRDFTNPGGFENGYPIIRFTDEFKVVWERAGREDWKRVNRWRQGVVATWGWPSRWRSKDSRGVT